MTVFLFAISMSPAHAEPVLFDGSWKEQGFLRLRSNDYELQSSKLDVVSNGTVSILWRALETNHRTARSAKWTWEVREGVIGTDLRRKGGDDRNLAIYFVFTDPETVRALDQTTPRRLLRNHNTHALVYVWGGEHASGSILKSPYHSRMRTLVLRPSSIGYHSEHVDLAADYSAAFGSQIGTLVGVGVSADSDDTGGRVLASIENLELIAD